MHAVLGSIKDADHDYLIHSKNLALASGVKVTEDKKIILPTSFKAFGIGIRMIDACIVFVPFIFFGQKYELWQMILLILCAVVVLYLSIKLLTIKIFEGLEGASQTMRLFAVQGVVRFSLLPVMLIPVIGFFYAFILIIFPMLWYILAMPLTGKKLFKNLM